MITDHRWLEEKDPDTMNLIDKKVLDVRRWGGCEGHQSVDNSCESKSSGQGLLKAN